jgi:hypothetical protein
MTPEAIALEITVLSRLPLLPRDLERVENIIRSRLSTLTEQIAIDQRQSRNIIEVEKPQYQGDHYAKELSRYYKRTVSG